MDKIDRSTTDTDNKALIRPYTPSQIAALYEMSYSTFKRRTVHLEPRLGKRIGHAYNTRQVIIIMNYLDELRYGHKPNECEQE